MKTTRLILPCHCSDKGGRTREIKWLLQGYVAVSAKARACPWGPFTWDLSSNPSRHIAVTFFLQVIYLSLLIKGLFPRKMAKSVTSVKSQDPSRCSWVLGLWGVVGGTGWSHSLPWASLPWAGLLKNGREGLGACNYPNGTRVARLVPFRRLEVTVSRSYRPY